MTAQYTSVCTAFKRHKNMQNSRWTTIKRKKLSGKLAVSYNQMINLKMKIKIKRPRTLRHIGQLLNIPSNQFWVSTAALILINFPLSIKKNALAQVFKVSETPSHLQTISRQRLIMSVHLDLKASTIPQEDPQIHDTPISKSSSKLINKTIKYMAHMALKVSKQK